MMGTWAIGDAGTVGCLPRRGTDVEWSGLAKQLREAVLLQVAELEE